MVVPAYNIQKYIKQAIRSIQNQEMVDLDIVIVNDAELKLKKKTGISTNKSKRKDPFEVGNERNKYGT